MDILQKIAFVLIIITFVVLILSQVIEIIRSKLFYKRLNAELDLLRGVANKDHDLRHAIVEFGDWLMDEYEKAKTEMYEKPNKYNDGKLTATQDVTGEFLNKLEEYIGDWEDGRNENKD